MKIVATTSLPAVDRPNADRWNAARSRQKLRNEWHHWVKFILSNSLKELQVCKKGGGEEIMSWFLVSKQKHFWKEKVLFYPNLIPYS